MRQIPFIVNTLFYALAIALAVTLASSATRVADVYRQLSMYQSADEKVDTLLKNLAQDLSFGLYQGGAEKAAKIAAIDEQAAVYAWRAELSAWGLLAVSVVFLLVRFARLTRGDAVATGRFIGHLFSVSGIFLAVGLSAPILTIVAHGEVKLLGEVVVQYDSRGVLTTVAKLLSTRNYFVGLLLLLFSVVIPVLKILLAFLVLAPFMRAARAATLRIIHVIGTWSMTDVFVVAILLAFFAADTEQFTEATLGPGLYFFAGYGLLSLFAGQLLLRHRSALLGGPDSPR